MSSLMIDDARPAAAHPSDTRDDRPTESRPISGRASGCDPEVDLSKGLEETLRPIIESAERRYLEALLEHTRGRIQRAARIARISRRTMQRKLAAYQIDKADFRQPDRRDPRTRDSDHPSNAIRQPGMARRDSAA